MSYYNEIKVWNSISVQQTLEKLRMGIQTNLDCFHTSDIELKAANILWQSTPEEIEEFDHCSDDIVYFVEKYCRFLTDKGRRIVKLMDYQKNVLKNLAKEHYDKLLDNLIPDIRNIIMMQARQSYKCLFNGDILLRYPNGNLYKVPISLFYYMCKGKLTFLEKIKVKLLIWYNILNLTKN
jgi:hypothetical protein